MKIDEKRSFGTRECPACACECAANENRCPICGYVFAGPGGNPLVRHGAWIALGLVLLFVLGFVMAIFK